MQYKRKKKQKPISAIVTERKENTGSTGQMSRLDKSAIISFMCKADIFVVIVHHTDLAFSACTVAQAFRSVYGIYAALGHPVAL